MSVKTYNAECDYPITTPSGRVIEPPTGRCWSLSKNSFFERLNDNRIWFGAEGNSVPSIKRFLTELKFDGMAPQSIMFYKDVGHSQEGAKEVTSLLEAGVFNGPKPIRLLNRLLTLANTEPDSIILDFFSGSATTAHAVMQLNAEDGGNRRFIMVQLPEVTDEKSEAYKAGYKNICEIGKERIRRAGKKLTETDGQAPLEEKSPLDVGFKVFKLDSSNLKLWDDTPITGANALVELEARIRGMIDVIKPDRSELDIVYEVMLKLGQELTQPLLPITLESDRVVYGVGTGEMDEFTGKPEVKFFVCLAYGVTPEDANEMAEYAPGRIVFADSCFDNTEQKSNVQLSLKDKGIAIKAL